MAPAAHVRRYPGVNCRVVDEPNMLVGHAFISYVREDSHRVDQLQQTLEAAGVRVWRDTADLWPGEDWRAKIRRAITSNAFVFIACFSNVSVSRNRSYQNEELTLAIEQLRQRRPDDPWLIPVRFDACDIPDRDIGPAALSPRFSMPTCSVITPTKARPGLLKLYCGFSEVLLAMLSPRLPKSK